MTGPRVIELVEYAPRKLRADELTPADADVLWRQYSDYLDVEYPSPRTGNQWVLTPKSWVGFFPVTPGLAVAIRPKLDVRSVFAMLEYAYDLKNFQLFDGSHACAALEELIERVAAILAGRVRDRVRRGVYRAYQAEHERLPYVRGRLDTARLVAAPWKADLPCGYEEHTADIEDNRLLLWALNVAARGGCTERSSKRVIDAHRSLAGAVGLLECAARSYRGRTYQRLNDDYRPMHGLGRFIVEHAGPRHEQGAHGMVPFRVDMNSLYERFVAAWLHEHLPASWVLDRQEHLSFGTTDRVQFSADLIIRERSTGAPAMVLDTKYKDVAHPKSDDLAQVVAYATAWGVTDAVLIYPSESTWLAEVGPVRVRALTFSISGDVETAGHRFLAALTSPDR